MVFHIILKEEVFNLKKMSRRRTEYVKYGNDSGTASNNHQTPDGNSLSPDLRNSQKKSIDLMDLEELLKNDLFLLGYI